MDGRHIALANVRTSAVRSGSHDPPSGKEMTMIFLHALALKKTLCSQTRVYPNVCILRIHLFLKMRYYGKHTAQDLAIQPLRLKCVISDKNHSLVAARKCNRRRTRESKLTLFVQDDVSFHHLVHGNCNRCRCQVATRPRRGSAYTGPRGPSQTQHWTHLE